MYKRIGSKSYGTDTGIRVDNMETPAMWAVLMQKERSKEYYIWYQRRGEDQDITPAGYDKAAATDKMIALVKEAQ